MQLAPFRISQVEYGMPIRHKVSPEGWQVEHLSLCSHLLSIQSAPGDDQLPTLPINEEMLSTMQ